MCICKDGNTSSSDCINDQLGSVIPGAAIHFKLKLLSPISQSAVYIDSSVLLPNSKFSPCQITPTSAKVHLLDNKCTNITYEIAVPNNPHYLTMCSLYMNVVNGESSSTRYVYYITINQCLPGFILQAHETEEVCKCNPTLLKAIPGLQCSDAKFLYITRPYNYWLAYNNKSNNTLYSECHYDYCLPRSSLVSLQLPDTQCQFNRTGVACGECPAGLSAIIGSSHCKRCSNWWLLLLPVFLCARLLLVLSLFLLNPTVADGKINGFILYSNLLIINSAQLFPDKGIAYTILSLCNLDLGIETCFYDGMSEYNKAWLRLSFPFYLFLLVGVLAYVSRYSSKIEKITRRRVIPVIATILLLSFTKLLLVTSSVLFSYTIVHSFHQNSKYHDTKWYWAVHTGIPLFGLEFCFLFVACLLLFVFFFIPVTLGLLFTKTAYRSKLLVKYLKPFIDVYQAPYKTNSQCLSGIALIVRGVALSVTSLSTSRVLAINLILGFLYLAYFSLHQPFKSQVNQCIYISYLCNLGRVPILVVYHNFHFNNHDSEHIGIHCTT